MEWESASLVNELCTHRRCSSCHDDNNDGIHEGWKVNKNKFIEISFLLYHTEHISSSSHE